MSHGSNRGQQNNRPLLHKNRRYKMTEEYLRKGTFPDEVVHPETNVKNRARITSKDIVRIRGVIIGTLPYVKISSLNGDAHSAKEAYSSTQRLTVSPVKSMISGGEGSVVLLKKSKHLGCVVQDTKPPKSHSILRKSTFGIRSHRSVLKKARYTS